MARLEGTNFRVTIASGTTVPTGTIAILTAVQAQSRAHVLEALGGPLTADGARKYKFTGPSQFKRGEMIRVVGALSKKVAEQVNDPEAPAKDEKKAATKKGGTSSKKSEEETDGEANSSGGGQGGGTVLDKIKNATGLGKN